MERATLIGALALAAASASAANPRSAWKLSGSGTETTLTLEAQANASLTVGSRSTTRPKLILKCHERKPMVGLFIGYLNEKVATVRFDSEPAYEVGLRNKTKRGKLWLPEAVDPETVFFDKPERMVGSLLRHRKMLVRVTPAKRPSQEVTFDLPRLDRDLTTFEKACDLKEPIERPSATTKAAAEPATGPSVKSPGPAPGSRTFGAWQQSIQTSKIDDLPIVLLSVREEGRRSRRTASLVLRCREQKADAFLTFSLPLFPPRGSDLIVRASVDGGTQGKEWWLSPSTDGAAFFFYSSAPVLLKRLLASNELRLAYRPRKIRKDHAWMPEGEAVFRLAGLDRASRAFLDACPMDLAKVKVRDGLPKIP